MFEGRDQLARVMAMLGRYNLTTASLLPRLDRWDTAAARLATELDLVLGTNYGLVRVPRRRQGRQGGGAGGARGGARGGAGAGDGDDDDDDGQGLGVAQV